MTIPNTGYAPWILRGEDGIIVSQTGIYVTISGAGIPSVFGAVYQTHLDTDESISTAPPTPAFNYGPGQPAVLLTLAAALRAGPALIRATFNGYLFNDDPPNETQPFVDVGLFVNGVQVARGSESFFFATSVPPQITIMPFTGQIEALITAVGGDLVELRWGVTGGGPHATAAILAAATGAPIDVLYATITAQELPIP